jgi:hypothetical protein
MKRTFLLAVTSALIISTLKSQTVKSPDEFLGYELGTQFTYHHKAVEYFKYIADNSPLAEYREYGMSYEGRPLGVCFISSEENLANLEEYRKNNLIKTGLLKGEFTGKQIPFIWLGYNVHGNESVGMETAMKTLYTLVTGSYKGVSEYLKGCIVVIDPCQNPDGRDLYTNRYRNSMNYLINPDGNSWEHNQGWPGARSNHYLFDLNRDWTWQTQAETQQRLMPIFMKWDLNQLSFLLPEPIHGIQLSLHGSMSFIKSWETGTLPFSMKNSDSILLKKALTFSIQVMEIHGRCLTEQWDLHTSSQEEADQVWRINLNQEIL